MTYKSTAVIDAPGGVQVREAEPAPFGPRSLVSAGMESGNRISELELDKFQVALVPFPPFDATGRRTRDVNGDNSRMVLLPITWRQLMARVRDEIAPATAESHGRTLRFGEASVDLLSMEVRRSNHVVPLTSMEFKVLKFFVLHPNRVISREELLDQVWGYQNYPTTRTVDNHILKLRRKLEADFSRPVHFRTVHAVGYKFTP